MYKSQNQGQSLAISMFTLALSGVVVLLSNLPNTWTKLLKTRRRARADAWRCAHVRFNCVYLRWRGTAADATPPRRSRLGLAGLSARDKPVEGTRDAVAKEDVEGGARAVARRGGHAWRAILECGL